VNYYNEFDPHAAAWLRGLIAEGHIPAGEVDERSITDVLPTDLLGFTSCHFFAGIGGWPLAGRIAGLPDDYRWWSGSCPCPPFSSAGKKKLCPECGGKPIPHPLKTGVFACVPCGHEWMADERHLYPEFLRLIIARQPSIVIGEQVAGADGLIWLAGVRATLEAVGYDPRAADLCAAGIASPQIRQRIMWGAHRMADTDGSEWRPRDHRRSIEDREASERHEGPDRAGECRNARGLGDPNNAGSQGHDRHGNHGNQPGRNGAEQDGPARQAGGSCDGLGYTNLRGCEPRGSASETARQRCPAESTDFWSDSRLILCRDGKHRRIPTQPSLFPLADGLPYKLARRGSVRPALLKGAGNAIVPELAAEFIIAFLEALNPLS